MDAYSAKTGVNLLKQLTGDKFNDYYDDVITVLSIATNKTTNDIPKAGTIRDFIFKENKLKHFPNHKKIYESFIKVVQEENKNNSLSTGYKQRTLQHLQFKGAELIDKAFTQKWLNLKQKCSRIEFHLSSFDDDWQWWGISQKWDIERSEYKHIKSEALKSFERKSKVSLVLNGGSGTGKTTLLRRLSFDLDEQKFKLLWIYDLRDFCNLDYDLIVNNESNYLIIVHDWGMVVNDPALEISFLSKLERATNIRIIIGDKNIGDQVYSKYIYSDNNIEIQSNDTQEIIRKIGSRIPGWRDFIDSIDNTNFYHAPLYITIFVIERSIENPNFRSSNDVVSIFRDAINSALKEISQKNKGLCVALYYSANIYIRYKASLTWDAFLEIAHHYNGDNSANIFAFFESNPTIKTLKHFFNLKKALHPIYGHFYGIVFHHDLIVDGLTRVSLDTGHSFDTSVKIEIARLLMEKEKYLSLHSYYQLLNKELKNLGFSNKDIALHIFDDLQNATDFFTSYINEPSLERVLKYEDDIEEYCRQGSKLNSESCVAILFALIILRGYSPENFRIVVEKIISSGCKNEIMLHTYQDLLDGNFDDCVNRVYTLVASSPMWSYYKKIIDTVEQTRERSQQLIRSFYP